jgi:hypothetical protein
MQDESIGWDPMLVNQTHPPFIVQIYALFLVIAVVATLARLVTLWIAAPPFRLSRRANSPIYLLALEASRNHFKQWMACGRPHACPE